MTSLLDLDGDRALDASVVGAKAARLARARRRGLPALPGVVIPANAGADVMRHAVDALRTGGSGAARLTAMGATLDDDLVTEVARAIAAIGPPVIVRSSSALETGGAWAGAFSSLNGIVPEDARTALRGVWASAFTVHALERCAAVGVDPASLELAVLVQRELRPTAGGTARVLPDGDVDVAATTGSPRDLLAGWTAGVRGRVGSDGCVRGREATDMVGAEVLRAAADLARRVADVLGDRLVEWAWAGGQVVLLQSAEGALTAPGTTSRAPGGLDDPLALRVARLAVRHPGPLGEALVLGWATGLADQPRPAIRPSTDPVGDLLRATAEADDLLEVAWQERPARARAEALHVFAALRGPEPAEALARLARLRPVEHQRGARVVALVEGAALELAARGVLPDRHRLWRCATEDIHALAAGAPRPATPLPGGPDRWEPFVHAVTAAQGRMIRGLPAVEGIAAGRVRVVVDPHDPPPVADRDVVVVDRALPAVAPLLWSAGALVTAAGSPAAHLLEVAHSLGVPAVVGADLDAVVDGGLWRLGQADWIAAVDGGRGVIALTNG